MRSSPSVRSRRGAYPPKARARRVPGVMNKSESAYASELERRRTEGEIEYWAYEKMALRLAKNTSLTVDFLVITSDGYVEFHEVKPKGKFIKEDAWVKLKTAAAMFPHFTFYVVRPLSKGEWSIVEVEPS